MWCADVADVRELFLIIGKGAEFSKQAHNGISVYWFVVVERKSWTKVECPLIACFVITPVVSEFWFDNTIVMAGDQSAIHLTQEEALATAV